MDNKLECLYCGSIITKEEKKCGNCGATIKDMIPSKKPEAVSEPGKFGWKAPILGALYSWPFMIILFLYLELPTNKILNSEINTQGKFIALILNFGIISLLCLLIHINRKKNYTKYLRAMKLYRTYVKTSKEEAEELALAKAEEKMMLARRIEDWETEKNKFEKSLKNTYGQEIARIDSFFSYKCILYNEHLIVTKCNNIKEEHNLNGYVDCELINSKLEDVIYIVLLEPTTQSKTDIFLNGKNGIRLVLDFSKTCSENRKNEIDQFFLKVKKIIRNKLD
jgi:hypothetical protein